MTVVCINDKWMPDPEATGRPCPDIGDKDTVVDVIERHGKTFYALERFGPKRGFLISHFVEINDQHVEDIEEKELEHATA